MTESFDWYMVLTTVLAVSNVSVLFILTKGKKEIKEDTKENEHHGYIIRDFLCKLDEKDRKLNELVKENLKLNSRLKEREHSLHITTIDYLQRTRSMHGRSILEMFQRMFIESLPGPFREKWSLFLNSNDPVAMDVMSKLSAKRINTARAAMIAIELYHQMSNDIHNALGAADVLYLVKDSFTADQLLFMKAIAKHVITEGKIKIISRIDWETLTASLHKEASS